MAIAEDKSISVEQQVAQWRERGVRNVRFELPDMHGTSRSKIVPIDHAAAYSKDGLNMYGGAAVLDTRSDVVPGTLYNEEVGYADQFIRPDPATGAVIPWAEGTARFICEATWADGRPLAASPRQVFRRVLDRAHELGYDPVIGMESEFYLLDPETFKPLFTGYHIFNSVRNNWVPAIDRIIDQMREFGIDIITANCEYAGSQWEINYTPGRGMAGPDKAFSFKNGVKEIARREGLLATFMSKPFSDSAGCGAHTHMSLVRLDGGKNAMSDDGAEHGLSRVGQQFIAGQLQHAASTYALLAPTVNCLKRRRRHTFSPTNVSWGPEDRSALVRIKGGSAESRHIENRGPSGLSNPYLVAAALLASGLLGIADGLELEPAAHPPAEEDDSKAQLPTSLEESLSRLEGDDRITEMLGEEFVKAYTVMRRHELQRFADHVTDWEFREYLEIY